MSAREIANEFSLPHSKVSYHLAILKKVQIVRERKFKNFIFYSLNVDGLREISSYFDRFKS